MKYSEQVKQLVEAVADFDTKCTLAGAYNSRNLALVGIHKGVRSLLIYRDWMERYPDTIVDNIHELMQDDEFRFLGTGDYVYKVSAGEYVCLRTYTVHKIESDAAMLCHIGAGEFSEMPYKGAVIEDGSMGIEDAAIADAAAFSMGVDKEVADV